MEFDVCFAASVQCYANQVIEADTPEDAIKEAVRLCKDEDKDSPVPMSVEPEWDSIDNVRIVNIYDESEQLVAEGIEPNAQPSAPQHQITVTVEGGVIQDISDIPPDVKVVVKDYDVEGGDPEDMKTDDNGDEYFEGIWNEGPADSVKC